MTAIRRRHILRMETTIAYLRVAVVLLASAAFVETPQRLFGDHLMTGTALAALAYALATVALQPYQWLPLYWWEVFSGFVDWGLITAWIAITGGLHSPFYLLYFLSILSVAMRYGLKEVLMAGVGTVIGYVALVLPTAYASPMALEQLALRMGHLLLFAFGGAILARETTRHFRLQLKEEARRLAMQEVTATVSHDLKNPLNAIAGLVEILLESAPDTLSLEQRSLLHRIDANAQQMGNLVANLLDAELIERGRQSFQPVHVDVNALVRHVVEAQVHQAEMKHIGLVLDLAQPLPVMCLDGRLIERLVANLLNNALKFTPEDGAVRVSTRQRGPRLVIEVWDSGPGVPPALHPVLFEKFARHNDSVGAGLGLYICKSIVDLHRGNIAVHESEDGVSFVVEIPITTTQHPAAKSVQKADDVESYAWGQMRLNAAGSR